jgi:MFS family permease
LQSVSLSKRGWKGIFDALSIRSYRLYWAGTLANFFGGQLQIPAQSWLAFEITNSPLKLTLVMAMQAFPMVLFSLFSGVIVDRVQKRNVIVVTQSFNVLVTLAVAILLAAGKIQYWHLLVSSLLNGINIAFNMPARNAILAELVPREKIYNAIALNNGGANVAAITGPALSGIIIGVLNIQSAYYVAIAFYIASIVILSFLPATSKLNLVTERSVIKNLVEGWRYLKLHQILIIALVMELAITIFGMCYGGLMPVFAKLFNQESEGYGFMLSVIGIGSLLGALFVASLGNFKRKGWMLLISGVIFGLMLVLFANSRWLSDVLNVDQAVLYIASFWLLILGISTCAYTCTSNAILQMNASDEFRGRINSILGIVIGIYPLSTLGVGAIAEAWGAPLALTIAGVTLTLFMLLMAIFSRRLRKME